MRLGHRVCVIGAGTMGSGIAAHLANLGFSVTLLDRTNASIESSFARAKASRPPHFYVPQTAESIRLGSIEDNLEWVSEADWVCEAIIERLAEKQNLFAQIEDLVRPDALVSTNTSGLQLSLLIEGRNEAFQRRLIGTHFFNPPRHLKLLELVPTSKTDPHVIETAMRFFEEECARRVIVAKDTPGFITNRFGMWSMYYAIHVAEKLGLSIEAVDLLTGPLIGRPKSGSFRLNDLVGLDVMEDIARNLIDRCPDDPHTKWLKAPTSISYLVEKGWIGSKVGNGYYKKEGKDFVSFDLVTHAYREHRIPAMPVIEEMQRLPLGERLRSVLNQKDEAGEFLREYLLPTLRYADYLKSEISHNIRDFDRAMMWGFGWEAGPFEMIDMIGENKVGITGSMFYQSTADGQRKIRGFDGGYHLPAAEPEFRTISDFPIIEDHESFRVRDLGDGVSSVGLTTKMGIYTPAAIDALLKFLTDTPPTRMVLTSELKINSAGFDLKFLLKALQEQDWEAISTSIENFQQLGRVIQTIPSVAAISGLCLGGGYEMASSCSMIAATAETQIGLPEAKVGLIPGGGGVVMARQRVQTAGLKQMVEVCMNLTQGLVATNADEARSLGYMKPSDVTVYHPDRLITEAKRLALTVAPVPAKGWAQTPAPFLGMAREALRVLQDKGDLTQHDFLIGDKIAHVFSKATSYEAAFTLERTAFLELCREGLTQARIKHMIENGKPLRN